MKQDKQKISFFLISLLGGGAERVFVNLANEFVSRGLDVDLILAQKEGPYLREVSNKVNIIDFRSKRVLLSLFPLVKYLKKEKPDVLISSMEHANIIAILAKIFSRSKTRIVVRVANTLSLSLQGTMWTKRWIRLYGAIIFYRLADEIIANSNGSADDLAKTLKISRNRIKVIYNPIVIPKILRKAEEESVHPWLKHKTLPVIIAVGRLFDKQKDFSTLIKAFVELRKQKEVRLIILGEGKDRKKLENLIKELNLKNFVDMPGFADNPYAYMAKSDVYALSSQWEGLPNTLIEAMACGTPVVSTDCPSGPAEILENGKYGKLVPVGDADALAQAIIETLDNPFNPQELRKRAGYFSIENAVNKYLELIGL